MLQKGRLACKSGCHGCPALHRRIGPLAPHDNLSLAKGHHFCPSLASNHLLCCWSVHKSLAPRTRTLLGVLGQATLNFVAVATLLFFFFCECPKFCDLAKQRREIFWGFLRSGKSILRFIFSGCASFSLFFFLLLRLRDTSLKRGWISAVVSLSAVLNRYGLPLKRTRVELFSFLILRACSPPPHRGLLIGGPGNGAPPPSKSSPYAILYDPRAEMKNIPKFTMQPL